MQLHVAMPEKKSAAKTIEVSEIVFGQRFNEPLVHQVVTTYLANARQGTHAQKNRSAVAGGGKKPFKQKGSGRARAGTIRSPLWRKGGVTFAASTQDYSKKLNKKMYRVAMRSILSELVRQDRLLIVDSIAIDSHKTKDLLAMLKKFDINSDVLIVADAVDKNLYLASRNLVDVSVCDTPAANPVSLVGHSKVMMTSAALKQIEEVLA